MSSEYIQGSCLCGEVKYRARPPFKVFQYCHCSRCRKFTGSAHAANVFVDSDKFELLQGLASVVRYEPEDTKYFATCFCKRCGSSLPWKSKGFDVMIIPAGTLDEDPGIRPDQNIYWQSRAPWYVQVSELPFHDALPKRPKKDS